MWVCVATSPQESQVDYVDWIFSKLITGLNCRNSVRMSLNIATRKPESIIFFFQIKHGAKPCYFKYHILQFEFSVCF
jgi:hypothetical protein